MQPGLTTTCQLLKISGTFLSPCVSGTSSGKWIRTNAVRRRWTDAASSKQVSSIPGPAPPAQGSLAQGRCLWQPWVGCGHWHQIQFWVLGLHSALFFFLPLFPQCGLAQFTHYTSSPWLMGHFEMTQPPQANSVPPADRSLAAAGTAQEAWTLSSCAGTAKCVVWALLPGE